jgi:hypothetical protein
MIFKNTLIWITLQSKWTQSYCSLHCTLPSKQNYKVHTAMTTKIIMKSTVFWVETLYSSVITRYFRETYCLHLQGWRVSQASTLKTVCFMFTAVRTSGYSDWLWTDSVHFNWTRLTQISMTAASDAHQCSVEERKWTWFCRLPWPNFYPASAPCWLHFCLFNWFNPLKTEFPHHFI